ncbi:L,D-transpeptidase [Brucella tritici]|uniref:L,D-transpeptidase n=1 Tax=Brucella tritici TaxID=94626 RepID=A0A6L3YGN2_9HYPH|nr:L,D-transpeptidase [Brucella tritici]KAB2662228.1 L,D-transpeptidase [Brucella tritici]KAB2675356.1 L,D-transpeptidase [Brucella tritici]KAB2682055.1 L,D-transpeptidase [Brucella tritici]NKW10065.1 L,D-transpeptidase [Brucella tritici]
MFSRRILMAGIASLCIGAAAPAFAASPVSAEAQLNEAAATVQQVALSSDAKANPEKPKKKKASKSGNTVKANKYSVDPKFRPQEVAFTGYKPGTIVIDPKQRFLYLVETSSTARRYGIAVGKQGLEFQGTATISAKREWPRWIPTKEMIERDPAHYGRFKNGMDGGPGNPLGSRAMYLFQGNKDTYIRIHGTVQPWTIGSSASNGCFRMINEDVMDLYERVGLGTEVVVL